MGQEPARAALRTDALTVGRPHPILPVLAAAATGFQVGAAVVATRFVIDQTDPTSLAFLRYAIALLCLAPVVFAISRPRIAARDCLPIALLGMGQFGLLIWLLNTGLLYIPAARGALIFSTIPLLTLLVAVTLGQERLSPAKSLGVLLSIAGVAVTLGEKALAGGWQAGAFLGELAVLGSAATGAFCNVLYRPYLARYDALPVALLSIFAAVCLLAVWVGFEADWSGLTAFSPPGWAAVAFIGVSSAVGFWLWTWALKHAAATKVAVFLTLSPFVATALGFLLLGEAVSLVFFAGLLLVVAGLVLAQR